MVLQLKKLKKFEALFTIIGQECEVVYESGNLTIRAVTPDKAQEILDLLSGETSAPKTKPMTTSAAPDASSLKNVRVETKPEPQPEPKPEPKRETKPAEQKSEPAQARKSSKPPEDEDEEPRAKPRRPAASEEPAAPTRSMVASKRAADDDDDDGDYVIDINNIPPEITEARNFRPFVAYLIEEKKVTDEEQIYREFIHLGEKLRFFKTTTNAKERIANAKAVVLGHGD